MSRLVSGGEQLSRAASTCRNVFWRASEEDISANMEDDEHQPEIGAEDDVDNDITRGGSSSSTPEDESDGIEPGRRSPHWYERMENMAQQNRKRSVENRNLLGQIDLRTVWIARILVALLATILGALILQVFLLP